jgi:hypothetical protein
VWVNILEGWGGRKGRDFREILGEIVEGDTHFWAGVMKEMVKD